MRILMGTANVSQRPNGADLRGTGARLTQALASRAQEQDRTPSQEPTVPKRAPRPTEKKGPKKLKMSLRPDPRTDPLAWAKAAAALRDARANCRTPA